MFRGRVLVFRRAESVRVRRAESVGGGECVKGESVLGGESVGRGECWEGGECGGRVCEG